VMMAWRWSYNIEAPKNVEDELTIFDVVVPIVGGIGETLHFAAVLSVGQVILDEVVENDINPEGVGFTIA
jgi:hypothetical protein